MRYFSLLSLSLFMIVSAATSAQVKVTEIDEHHTQLDFGYQIMMVHFNIRPADEQFRPLTGGFSITGQERSQYVDLVKEEILKLPRTFVTRYVIDNVFILALSIENTLGYHSDDLIVLEGRESEYTVRRTLFHEIAHEISTKSEHQAAFKDLVNYLDANRSRANALSYLRVPRIYETGHSTAYAQKSAEEEFSEIFADLMMPHADMPLIQYVTQHPESILAEKVKRMISFLTSNNCKELNYEFFIGLSSSQVDSSKNVNAIAKGN